MILLSVIVLVIVAVSGMFMMMPVVVAMTARPAQMIVTAGHGVRLLRRSDLKLLKITDNHRRSCCFCS